jgi:aspartate-semialdehyde dehydrogenase
MSKEWASIAAKKSIVIDNSSLFRMDQEIPLIVPEVNADDIVQFKNKNIIANPNCSTAQLVVALKPLHDLLSIERVVVSTYQSVSGAGKDPMSELTNQTKQFLNKEKIIPENFTKQIAFNVIPHIDEFTDEGYTKEELKMVNETQKILSDKIKLTATCVRVPVLVSHCESVNIQFERSFTLDQIYSTLSSAKGCKVIDERKNGGYITPIEAEGQFDTYISRIRIDSTQKNCLNMWVVSDNLLKGAALNAVQIAETLVDKQLI